MEVQGAAESKSPVQLRISEINQGIIVTDWEPIEGREAGLLWWRNKYETQARHNPYSTHSAPLSLGSRTAVLPITRPFKGYTIV